MSILRVGCPETCFVEVINWQSALHLFIFLFLMPNFSREKLGLFTTIKIDLLFSSLWDLQVILEWFDLFYTRAFLLTSCFSLKKCCCYCCTCNPASIAYVTLCLQESCSAETELFLCCPVVKSVMSFQKLYLKMGLKLVGFRPTFSKQLLFCLFVNVASWTHLKGSCLLQNSHPLLWRSLVHFKLGPHSC